MNLNKVFIVGRLTRDPEKRTIPESGTSVVNIGVATNSYFTDKSGTRQEKTEFHNIVCFGNLADTTSQYLKKGSLALFEGRMQTSSWDDKDGNKRYKTEIVAEKVQFGPKNEGETGGRKESNPDTSSQKREIPVIDEDDDIDVEDIPF